VTFAQFFEALWNQKPFPWQERLAALALEGRWPASIGLPTAAGKTALIDIAVYALAMRAPNATRRTWFVVDRRIIVDEAAERAAKLADKLCSADPASGLGRVAQALRDIGGNPKPLETAVLRGGIPRDQWMDSPIQPLVICSTVGQVGSSLLFRAYGASEYGRSIPAGLAAYDSLIILDEAHTSHPFAETLGLVQKYRTWAEQPLNLPFTVVEMSATPRQQREVFREQVEDRNHAVLRKRWGAEKRARLAVEMPKTKGGPSALVEGLVREARRMRDEHGAKVVGVIANRVLTARSVHQALQDDLPGQAILLTGRARPYDRDQIWSRWRASIGMGRQAEPEHPLFVVATQCIEVGANIDFDALVTEIASIDALEQRFGRLNRRGRDGISHAAIVAQKDQVKAKYKDPLYGGALAATWDWLEHRLHAEEGTVSLPAKGKKKPMTKKVNDEFVPMGVLALRQDLEKASHRDALIMPRRDAPLLIPAHVDLLCQTSPEPALSPEVALFLHGPETEPADIQVIWRGDLEDDSERWADTVAICPPSAAEAIAVPVWAVRSWLSKNDTPDLADVEGLPAEDSEVSGENKPVLGWRVPEDSDVVTRPGDIRPGMTLVVPASYGGCDEWGWNPESELKVADVGDAVKLQMGRPLLRLHPQLAADWQYPEMAARLRGVESAAEARAALAQYVSTSSGHEWIAKAARALTGSRSLRLVDSPDGNGCVAISGRGVFQQESVSASFTEEVLLQNHLVQCGEWGARFARDLPARFKATVVAAAGLHDVGKADRRFQAWLRGGNPIKAHELIAKSKRSGQNGAAIERARQLAGYPQGGRHELSSIALLANQREQMLAVDFDLLLHLVGAHHGRCRPFAPLVDDLAPISIIYNGWEGLERPQTRSLWLGGQ
jgi:CRISPR-associated endonuclease/helicase Cas3